MRKDNTLTITLPTGAKEKLEALAIAHNCKWGSKPNISLLIERIANGEIPLQSSFKAKLATKQAQATIEAAIEALQEIKGAIDS
jgi:hypothetical protein